MTYRPAEAAFPPPWRARLPSLIYLMVALAIGAVVLAAEMSSSNSKLYVWVIENNSTRIISPSTFSLLLLGSAVAMFLREGMRGVRVLGDGIEYRDVVSLVIPKRRKLRWPQMDRIILDQPSAVAIDLWDGTRAFLPPVNDRGKLSATLERVALARAIPVRGGQGVDELPDELARPSGPNEP